MFGYCETLSSIELKPKYQEQVCKHTKLKFYYVTRPQNGVGTILSTIYEIAIKRYTNSSDTVKRSYLLCHLTSAPKTLLLNMTTPIHNPTSTAWRKIEIVTKDDVKRVAKET